MSEQIYLSRRNLLVLLSKLDRQAAGEDTACTIIKYRNETDPFYQSMDSVRVTAIEDEEYYTNRTPGHMNPLDEPDVHTRDAPTSEDCDPRVMEVTLNLADLSVSPLMVGRDFGKATRKQANLDEIDQLGPGVKVNVCVNDDTYSMSSSFFLGMFEDSIRKLGKDKFLEKYKLNLPPMFVNVALSCVHRVMQETNLIGRNDSQ